jgi:hypothetical protein
LIDSALSRIINSWANLPEETRQAMLALLKTENRAE